MCEIRNEKAFKTLISNNDHILIDFYADWCGPCQTLLPIVEKLSKQ